MNYPFTKSETYAAAGTTVFCIIMLILLCLLSIKMHKPEFTEHEIEINFGDGADGTPAPVQTASITPQTAQTTQTATSIPQNTSTHSDAVQSIAQEDPSVAIAEEKKRKEKQQQEQRRLEEQRIKAEQAAKRAEEARQAAIAKEKADKAAKASAMAAGAFGGGGTSASGTGPGGGGKNNTPGNPLGHGTSNGSTWSLINRNLASSIPKPAYVGDQEGTIVVTITVDNKGNVIGTDIGKGTTITDQSLRNECRNKAKLIKFTPNPKVGNQIGTITYKFKER